MKKYKNKIILIGGAAGVGKSTLSKKLMTTEKIVHKIGTGFVREMAKSFIQKKNNKSLYTHSFETSLSSPIKNLYLQSIPLKKMLKKVVDRSNREGTSMIIEGVNLIPGLIDFDDIDERILLIVKDERKHLMMIKKNNTHMLRKVPLLYFENIRKIQSSLIERAKKFKWKILDTGKVYDAR